MNASHHTQPAHGGALPRRPGAAPSPQPRARRAGSPPQRQRQGGIALLEVMLAIVILGIGLLGTVGLQARAYSALSDAGMRAEATLAAEKLIGVINADLPNIALYNLAEGATANDQLSAWVTETRGNIPGAILSVAVQDQPAQNRYQVDISIRWQRKARSETNRHRVTSYIAR